jgi:4-amino-4-deoxy-L-arabinose transferase-like glycosyltransferase
MNDRRIAQARTHWSVWVLLALSWFATLGWRPLFEPDEGRYAEIPREMLVSGDWVTPRLNGYKYFEKPALQYWATAAVYSLFGTHEWTSRLWSATLAFLCVPMVYGFARRVYHSESAGVSAAAALTSNPFFVVVGHLNLLDSGLCFFLTGALFAYLLAGEEPPGSRAERNWMMLSALSLALAVLSKGPVAIVLAGMTALLHILVTGTCRPIRRWWLSRTVPLFLLVCVPWFVVVSIRNPEFPRFFFLHEHVDRFLTDAHERVEPWWFFVPCVVLATLPWMHSAIRGLSAVALRSFRNERYSTSGFLGIFCVVTFVFFSVSHSKLAPYVLPMMPALAVLLAPRIASRVGAPVRAALIISVLFILLGAGLWIATLRGNGGVPIPLVVWIGVAFAVGVGGALVSSRAVATRASWVPAALGTVLSAQALMMAFTYFPPAQSSNALVARVRPFIGPRTQLFSVDQYRQSVPPYLGRTLRLVRYEGEMKFGIEAASDAGYIPTLETFAATWDRSTDALAIVDVDALDALRARQLPFQLRATDGRSVVITRR